MSPKLFGCLVGGVFVLFFNPVVFAAEDERLSIIVTGTRTAQTVDETLAPVTVIDREQIENSSATTVNDLLRATPGLSLTSNGGQGSNTSVFLRGTESDHTLVLVDGIRMSSATSGTASFQNIPLNQIERIEIIRGPRSSLYGSDAIGGVIQIFTRRAQSGYQSNAALSAGSHSSRGLNAGFSHRNDKNWVSTQISNFETDGFDACRAEAGTEFGGCFTDEPDDDGYQNNTLSLAGGLALSPKVEASLNFLRSDSELDFDGSFSNSSESSNQIVGAKLNVAASDSWVLALTAGRNEDHSDTFNQGVFDSAFNTDRDQLGLQNDVNIGEAGLLTFGVDYYDDKVSGSTAYAVSRRDNTGIYAQYQGDYGANDVQLSLRNDDNEQFGTESTGGINLGRDLNDSLRLTAGYGTAFKAPTFNELYFPDFGNANLQTETADSIDVGLAWKGSNATFKANIFETRVDDLITFDALSNAPVNIDKARIQGMELSIASQLAGWDVNAGITYVKPENDSAGDDSGNVLARRPQQSTDIAFARSWNAFSLGLNAHHQGHSFDDLENTKRLDGFTTVGAKLGYQFTPRFSLDLSLNNLFDEEYETAQFYNQDGFNGLMSLRYTGL